jgi:integrase/recombinase XerD
MSELAIAPREGRELTGAEKRGELIQIVVDSVASEHSKRDYRTGLELFFEWWERDAPESVFSRALVQRYRSHLEAQAKS